MATETPRPEHPETPDLDTSPFERQAIEALPLTKEERAVVRRVIEEARREREEMARSGSSGGPDERAHHRPG